MKLHNLIKPAVLTLALPLAFSASAWEPVKASATDYNFVTVKAGGVFPTSLEGNSGLNTGDSAFTAGFEAGRKFMDRYSVGLEYMYRDKNTAHAYNVNSEIGMGDASWSARSDTLMLNLAADLITDSKVTPYFKVGVGASRNKAYDYTTNIADEGDGSANIDAYAGKTTTEFAWQAGAGLAMKTTKMFDTQLEYMFVDRGQIKTEENYVGRASGDKVSSNARTGRLKEHVVTIGLKFKF